MYVYELFVGILYVVNRYPGFIGEEGDALGWETGHNTLHGYARRQDVNGEACWCRQ
jgi:hypothetical protein